MKKITKLLVLCMMIAAFSVGCGDSKSNLAKANLADYAEAVSRDMPQDMGDAGIMESITYDMQANQLTFTFLPNPQWVNVARLDISETKKMVIFSLSDPDNRSMLESYVAAGASLRFIYRDNATGEECDFVILPKELEDALANKDEDKAMAALQAAAANARKGCPTQMDEGIYLSDCRVTDSSFCYKYEVSGDYSLDIMNEQRELMKHQMIQNLSSDPSIGQLAGACALTGRSIDFIYEVEDQGSMTISIDPSELKI